MNNSDNKQNTMVPKLRFPEFIGSQGWVVLKFGQLYSFKVTNSFSREKLNYDFGFVKNIHYGDIHKKFSTLFDINHEVVPFINPAESIEKIKDDNYCIEGDIIFADASEDLDGIGKNIELVELNNEKLLSGLHTLLARQKYKKIVIGFGGYLFNSDKISNQIKKEAQGAKVFGISSRRLSNIEINYPVDQKEQQKIVDCLSSVDDLILAQENKINSLQKHKKGLMQQLLPIKEKNTPKLRFPNFKNDKKTLTRELGSLSKITAGATPESTNSLYWDGKIPWMNSGELNKKRIYSVSNFITELGLKESSTKLIPSHCVLIGLAGQGKTRGTAAINYISLCTNQSIAAIHPNEEMFISDFLFHQIDAMYDQLRALSKGEGGRGGLNLQIIKSVEVYLPTLKEQQKIADCLSSIDELISLEIKKLELFKIHKKGLMQQLFPSMDEVS